MGVEEGISIRYFSHRTPFFIQQPSTSPLVVSLPINQIHLEFETLKIIIKHRQNDYLNNPLPNPNLNPLPLPQHGNRQPRRSLQTRLARCRLDGNGNAPLRRPLHQPPELPTSDFHPPRRPHETAGHQDESAQCDRGRRAGVGYGGACCCG